MASAAANQPSFRVGQTIAGRYRLERPLGAGSMGQVWVAEHMELRSRVALKFVEPGESGGVGAYERLTREARAAAALRSPHVVQVLDYGMHDETVPYVAMEMLEGETLAERIERVQGPLPTVDTIRIVTHVARAMGRAHELGIVHRDLKPDNIFLVRNDDEEIAKVLDFGIARVASSLAQRLTTTAVGTLLGTPNYMSPEQVRGEASVGPESDLWSLAIIAFECVMGVLPYTATQLGVLMLRIANGPPAVPSDFGTAPDGFDAWFLKAANPMPSSRFPSAKAMAESLREVLLRDVDDPTLVDARIGRWTDRPGSVSVGTPHIPGAEPPPSASLQPTILSETAAARVRPERRRSAVPVLLALLSIALVGLNVRLRPLSAASLAAGVRPAVEAQLASDAVPTDEDEASGRREGQVGRPALPVGSARFRFGRGGRPKIDTADPFRGE